MKKLKSLYTKYQDEIGIFLSYFIILTSSYFVDWNAYGILMSYLFETAILFIFFIGIRLIAEHKNPNRYRKQQSYGNLVYGVVPFFVFQYFILAVSASIINNDNHNYFKLNNLLSYESLFSIGALGVFYLKKIKDVRNSDAQYDLFMNNFLFKVIVLTVTTLVCLIILTIFDRVSLFVILSATIPIRIGFELFFRKKFEIMRR